MKETPVINVDRLSKKYCRSLRRSLWYGARAISRELIGRSSASIGLRVDEFWALKNISFELRRGECLGLVGNNGAGKTTLLRLLNGLIRPDSGCIHLRGSINAIIALNAGFNPILTGRENILVNAAILGLRAIETRKLFSDIVEFSELGEFIDSPVATYSSGMTMRLGFAIATAIRADVVLLDEVLAVGDVSFRAKCINRIGDILNDSAVVFVSHDAYSVRRICNKALWLHKGEQRASGPVSSVMEEYAQSHHTRSSLTQSEMIATFITDFRYEGRVEECNQGAHVSVVNISLSIRFDSERQADVGIAAINIVAGEDNVIAQAIIRSGIRTIRKGRNEWSIDLPNIRLASGHYSVVLGVFDDSCRHLIISVRHRTQFHINGNQQFDSVYALESVVSAKAMSHE